MHQGFHQKLCLLEWTTINTLIKKEVKLIELDKVKTRHENKLTRLWINQKIKSPEAVKNLSSYKLSNCGIEAIRYGLEHHILPCNLDLIQEF